MWMILFSATVNTFVRFTGFVQLLGMTRARMGE